eukprot:CAMPEP_0201516166 /NCGR_PEP_ID=MMETSP0161_2-20130828/7554_1 /ASSEMBLY_ACC=CAM_ASM_000251 /TAXON_ID=180227 /ORGANISM="Neoparamoeba aestuarina, Strain SoJaBio B1-5/56/2" /LENGTH=294 /DNA_ID=CAMNT_0047913193 /DNA_START=121 /DNA_END=1005 /DNA_ORIENTATION=+
MSDGDYPASLSGADDMAKMKQLCSFDYRGQACWYLNAFWPSVGEKAEQFWEYVEKASKIDNAGKAGTGLDELEAHRFLEAFNDVHTVLEMRSKLRSTGAIAQNERPKTVPLVHYLLFTYENDWHILVNATQGDNSGEIAIATKKLQEVQALLDEAAAAEAPFKKACLELEAARAEVAAQEKAYNDKTESLKAASETGGVVSRNKAKVSLDAHLAEDPLPLRKSKLTLEAAQKRADKARAPFAAKVAEAEAALKDAEDYLNEIKKKPGCAHGSVWWLDRELIEKRKYLPKSKGGI